MNTFNFSHYNIRLEGDTGEFNVSFSGCEEQNGLVFIRLTMKSAHEAVPGKLTLHWTLPALDLHTRWNPTAGYFRGLIPDWSNESCFSQATFGAPVETLANFHGENKLTIAVSDALNPIIIKTGINEETASLHCDVKFFTRPAQPVKYYEAILRLDTRPIPYYEILNQVQLWWASMPGYQPADVPECARLPMYSTWYSFHQRILPAEIITQCKLAKEIGCESIIVDDGWQTDDNNRGYAWCGDWEVALRKIPDMREFVAAAHGAGLKFLLWYSVPFVGKHSKVWGRFKGKFLDSEENDWCVLDPRFPEVREYLIQIYEKAVREWDLDGLKLDFMDRFKLSAYSGSGNGRDYNSLEEATDRLLKDILMSLRNIKPDFMIEFRQNYIGPLMRTYGNMFRAGDVPKDSLGNRLRVTDIRLLCGNTAAHSDMLMWNSNEPVESAAMQIINVLHAVPQISVLLDKIPNEHYKMLRFWLGFWREHRDTLLDGEFMPVSPQANYSTVLALHKTKLIATCFSAPVVRLPEQPLEEVILINGSYEKRLLLEVTRDLQIGRFRVYDCCGDLVTDGEFRLNSGIHSFEVPPAGIVFIQTT